MKFVKRDGTPLMLISRKSKSLMTQRKKPAKLTWTLRWRIMNKKGKVEEGLKKRSRRAVKVQRAIMGKSADEIKKLKAQKPEIRSAQREAALREVKDRQKADKAKKMQQKASTTQGGKPNVPKQTKAFNKNARGGSKR
mmetsp:Transcript_3232/g.10700  ORF Transcript_3232/g.10700 Transcript_3232/m.10700 type:complete len:138 (-) Transcript_3232:999-1412(-)